MIYMAIDVTALFTVASNRTRAVTYLLGNHVVAESMFRHEARAMLYAPLGLLIHANGDTTRSSRWTGPAAASAGLGASRGCLGR